MVERIGAPGNDTLTGTSGDDVLIGNGGSDVLTGFAGNDVIIDVEGEATTIDAGAGDDTIIIGDTAMTGSIFGSSGTDVLRVGTGDLTGLTLSSIEILEAVGIVTATAAQFNAFGTIARGAGDLLAPVRLRLAPSDVALSLGAAVARGGGQRPIHLSGSASADVVSLGAWNDTVEGFGGDDSLSGLGGNDVMDGSAGNDTLDGGSGDDTLISQEGNDLLMGGAGNDRLSDTSGGLAQLYGGAGDDVIQIATARFSGGTIDGGTGNDTLVAGGTDLSVVGLGGIEVLELTMGVTARAAQLAGFSIIRLTGLPNSRVTLALSATGAVATLDLAAALGGLRAVTLTGSTDAESLGGGDLADRIDGGAGNDTLLGRAGADSLTGGLGDDWLDGGDGADTLVGGAGSDTLMGGAGNDLIQDATLAGGAIFGGDGDDRVEVFGPGTGTLDGGAGNDTLANGSATSGVDLSGTTITGFEVLVTNGQPIRLSASNLASFTTIRTGPVPGTVFLWLAGGGTFDLGTRLRQGSTIWNSVVTGSAQDDTILGGAGNDTIAGGNGNDLIAGGLGRNALSGGNGINTVTYAGFDRPVRLSLGTGQAVFAGGGDTLAAFRHAIGSALGDTLEGGPADNLLRGEAGADLLRGFGGNDTLIGGAGDDTLDGGAGADRLVFALGGGSDRLLGLEAGDVIDLSAFDIYASQLSLTLLGADTEILLPDGERILLVAAGLDLGTVDFGPHAPRRFDGTAGDDSALAEGLSGFSGLLAALTDATGDSVFAGAGNDTVLAGSGHDTLMGEGDDDTLAGNAGDDLIYGGTGRDSLFGGPGNDTLWAEEGDDLLQGGAGTDRLYGGAGNDTFLGHDPGDSLDGGTGIDLLDLSGADRGMTVDLSTLVAVENLLGGDFADWLGGDGGANHLRGGDGADTLSGAGGNDLLEGGAGNDLLDGGTGDDTLRGEGDDTFLGGAGNDRIELAQPGQAAVDGGSGNDTLATSGDLHLAQLGGIEVLEAVGDITLLAAQLSGIGRVFGVGVLSLAPGRLASVVNLTASGPVTLTGSADDETILAGTGADRLEGGEGSDSLSGGGGNDTLIGGPGTDTLDGGAGDDLIQAGAEDLVIGGSGTDTVVTFESHVLAADVEVLVLMGTGALVGTGNALGNTIQGNDGEDTLIGGRGGDIYIVSNAATQIVELPGEGNDTVLALASFSLSGVAAVENLTLIGLGDLSATGSTLWNRIVGNGGNNRLAGLAGNDTLTGGAGADTFVFGDEKGAKQITDFSLAEGDRIELAGLTAGVAHPEWLVQVGGDVRIDVTALSSILVQGASLAEVSAGLIW